MDENEALKQNTSKMADDLEQWKIETVNNLDQVQYSIKIHRLILVFVAQKPKKSS